jgi:hypothetical protein
MLTTRCLLERRYAAFVGMLEEASRENLEFLKDKTLKAISQLLAAKPEQEAHLLAALVNKLGDPSRKLASKVTPTSHRLLHCYDLAAAPHLVLS